ncbi:protein translocase subunit SecF [Janibacter indicus]|uniref:Protein-export membrane protein SecF n=1 Tax=Janibacter indicus TaxID=857417 RepID=A0A1W2D2U4_9MICO|nr:protein translocase subunit SecF [Janibacter indicus]SMC91486.1 protein translocase subunit secF [Janibacter indicus]
MSRMAQWGNDLYTGDRSIDFVGKSKTWYIASAVIMAVAALGFVVQGLNLSLEFTGGSEFRVVTQGAPASYEDDATSAVREVAGGSASANVTTIGGDTIRVQTEELDGDESREVARELASTFGVAQSEVSSNFIGPSWGASVSQQALRALVVFLVITTALMALYYRNWKMAVASMVALAHDMLITVGIYTWTGFEVSPATLIGFLTVLGYSLYDTVVVFDHVKENTRAAFQNKRSTFAHAANLAVNQTLVRSINTTVIAVLPIVAVLIIGFAKLGPGTLLDLSLALFIGMTVGAFSSVFIATPLLVDLRRKDADVVALDKAAGKHHKASAVRERVPARVSAGAGAAAGSAAGGADDGSAVTEAPSRATSTTEGTSPSSSEESGEGQTVTGRKVHKYAQSGPRNQPKKTARNRRGKG